MSESAEQELYEQKLRESEAKLRLVLRSAKLLLWEHDYSTETTVASEQIGAWHGLPEEFQVDTFTKLVDYIHPDDVPAVNSYRHTLRFKTADAFEFVYRVQIPNGPTRRFLTRAKLLPTVDHSHRSTGVIIDISKQHADEQQLRMLESVVVHARDAVIVLAAQPTENAGRKVLYVNRAFTTMSGYDADEVVGRSLHFLRGEQTDEQSLEHIRNALDTGAPLQTELLNYRKDGKTFWVELSLVPVPNHEGKLATWVMIQRDISDRKQAQEALKASQEQLYQAQKMEIVGQLAGGVAHDFNNLLTAILGNLSLVSLTENDPNHKLLQVAEQAAQRAADLTQKLLGFARRNQIIIKPIPVAKFLEEVANLLYRTFDPRISLQVHAHSELTCLADPTLLNQVLLNLCINARDAMPNGGKITVSATKISCNEIDTKILSDTTSQHYIKISIADTGTGMTPETHARIFEPFFTTKPQGQGTGLGLAMVHGIIKQHRGAIQCETQFGQGSQFHIYLPSGVSNSEDDDLAAVPEQLNYQESIIRQQENECHKYKILLVDDEEMIRALACNVLSQAQYDIIEASDGEQAIEQFKKYSDQIDLVILDMIMPKLSGRDAAIEIHRIRPDVKVLLSSGYTQEDVGVVPGVCDLLLKPYRPQELLQKVAAVMKSKLT